MGYVDWLNISSEELKRQITLRRNCDLERAEHLCSEIVNIDPILRPSFTKIWAGGGDDEVSVQGYNLDKLNKRFGMDPFKAVLTLDWLIKEPDVAKKALIRGYDSVR